MLYYLISYPVILYHILSHQGPANKYQSASQPVPGGQPAAQRPPADHSTKQLKCFDPTTAFLLGAKSTTSNYKKMKLKYQSSQDSQMTSSYATSKS